MYTPMSPVELVANYIRQSVIADLAVGKDAGLSPDNVKAGAVTITQQREGSVSVVEAGKPRSEPELPIRWQRVAVRCAGETYATADLLANYVHELTDQKNRIRVFQPSNNNTYLIHTLDVTAGNTVQIADQKLWETILYVQACIGIDAVA